MLQIFFVLVSLSAPGMRQWTDQTGFFSLQAEFQRTEGIDVLLRRADGTVLKIPIDKLSQADQDFVARELRQRPAEIPLAEIYSALERAILQTARVKTLDQRLLVETAVLSKVFSKYNGKQTSIAYDIVRVGQPDPQRIYYTQFHACDAQPSTDCRITTVETHFPNHSYEEFTEDELLIVSQGARLTVSGTIRFGLLGRDQEPSRNQLIAMLPMFPGGMSRDTANYLFFRSPAAGQCFFMILDQPRHALALLPAEPTPKRRR